jgi:hypothetical protein
VMVLGSSVTVTSLSWSVTSVSVPMEILNG